MDLSDKLLRLKPAAIDDDEWVVRLELAALYRAFDWLGWSESIFNHITARVPGGERHYLINPYGLNYSEVTATNLVKINLKGEVMDGSKYPVNVAGFVIHSAIHGAREDAHCIIHTHSTAGSAVASKKDGLRFDNFYSALLYGQVAYHDFEGVTTDLSEQARLVKSIGDKAILILRNHGLLVACPGIPQAYLTYWGLQRACEIQVATDAMRGENLPISQRVLDETPARSQAFNKDPRPGGPPFDALLRRAGIRYEEII
ncbi:MAG TPA: class II aldolase/adducin family protein [Burkholderiales bacterium]|nr:class II aldolase/adducin family protein [Burkholderiales bacterium]